METKTVIKVASGVRCISLPPQAKTKIEKDLSFPNPAYVTAKARGMFIPADMPAKVVLWDYEEETDTTWIPRGYLFWLLKFLRVNELPFEIQDCTLLLKPLNLKFLGELKPYQDKAKNHMMQYPVGVLEAATGSGKTVMGISIIVARQQPALIIVHGKELMYQWQEQIKKFTGEDCGLLGDGKFTIKPITVGIINTVNNKLDQLLDKFGHVVIDECHKIGAATWASTLQEFKAKHYLGLTATAYRNDGLGHAIFASIGPKIHQVDKQMLFDNKSVLVPNIYKINTSFDYFFKDDYSTMVKELTENNERNQLICKEITQDLTKYKQSILCVSDRKKHCETLRKTLLTKHKIKSLVLTGNQSKSDRETVVTKVRSGEYKVLFATVSLIGEGFDMKELSCLFLTTPIKYKGRIIQAIGRVLRPNKDNKNKVPRVYDFRDSNVSILRNQGFNRDRIYKKEWNR